MGNERYLPDSNSLRHQFSGVYRREADASPFASLAEITPADKGLLRETVRIRRPQSKNYEDSWGYVIQATRYHGLKWHDQETGSLIFFGRRSETDPTLVVPSFFATPAELTAIVNHVQYKLNVPQTIIKNVSPEDVTSLRPYGFRPYQESEGWSAEARFDDQTYPQQIVDLQKLMEKRGNAYHHLRKALNKYPDVTIRTYQETDKDDVLAIFAAKDGSTRRTQERPKGMYFESHAMYPEADIDKFVTIDNGSGEIIGFSATSDISPLTTASVASLFRPDATKARIWCTYHILAKKYDEGFQLANLGGSEFEATYLFRRRTFRPAEELEKTHLVYAP
jgi:hypothetical protein